jgi:hypothetical protein
VIRLIEIDNLVRQLSLEGGDLATVFLVLS